jgi:hypothetical protein
VPQNSIPIFLKVWGYSSDYVVILKVTLLLQLCNPGHFSRGVNMASAANLLATEINHNIHCAIYSCIIISERRNRHFLMVPRYIPLKGPRAAVMCLIQSISNDTKNLDKDFDFKRILLIIK